MASALANIHIIEGKPVMSADVMVGVLYSHDIVETWDIVEWTDKVCTIKAKRKGPMSPVIVTWTIEMAAQMGLLNKKGIGGGPGMWQKVPKQMLWARSSGEAARRIGPDFLSGCYAQEEMDEQALVREATDVTPRTTAPVNPARTLSVVTRAPMPTLEQGVRVEGDDLTGKDTVPVESAADAAVATEAEAHNPETGEIPLSDSQQAAEADHQAQPDDGSPEVVRLLKQAIANQTALSRDELRDAIRSINKLDDEAVKLDAKRLYNECSKLAAA